MTARSVSGGIFDFDVKKDRLQEVELELSQPSVWDKPERAQELGRERSALEVVVNTLETLEAGLNDCDELLEMAEAEADQDTFDSVVVDAEGLKLKVEELEFRRMFAGETDPANAYLDI